MLSCALRVAALVVMIPAFIVGGRPPRTDAELAATIIRASRWARRGCRILGIRVRRRGVRWPGHGRGGMIALNHLSWLDPLIMAAIHPSVFVTSTETGEHPLLGRICASAGCVFMDRRQRRGLQTERDRLGKLMETLPVVIFPEATSSNGATVLPFKPAPFAAAIEAHTSVSLLALRYCSIDGHQVTARNRDRVYWYGDMTFLPHLIGVLGIRRISARLDAVAAFEADAADDRKVLATRSHRLVSDFLHPHAIAG